jgi:hypothetical protein
MFLNKYLHIKKEIELLSKEEKIEIFKIIKANNVFYTQNNNGIFLVLNKLDDTIINEIERFLKFLEETKLILK